MRRKADGAAQHGKILQRHAAAQSRLRNNNAMAADERVVANLASIVDFGGLSDHGVPDAATVDHGRGADLDIVLNDHAAGLRNLGACDVAETILPDAAAGMDHHAVADQRMHD